MYFVLVGFLVPCGKLCCYYRTWQPHGGNLSQVWLEGRLAQGCGSIGSIGSMGSIGSISRIGSAAAPPRRSVLQPSMSLPGCTARCKAKPQKHPPAFWVALAACSFLQTPICGPFSSPRAQLGAAHCRQKGTPAFALCALPRGRVEFKSALLASESTCCSVATRPLDNGHGPWLAQGH